MASRFSQQQARESKISAEYARSLFHYEPKTGFLFWKSREDTKRANRATGKRAGFKATKGYRQVEINGVSYMAHRLIWLIVTGAWPDVLIDHINGRTDDNRWENLREATKAQNKSNQKLYKSSTSGFKGVSWSQERKRWVARITKYGKTFSLGRFKTIEEARDAYRRAAKKMHGEFANFGDHPPPPRDDEPS